MLDLTFIFPCSFDTHIYVRLDIHIYVRLDIRIYVRLDIHILCSSDIHILCSSDIHIYVRLTLCPLHSRSSLDDAVYQFVSCVATRVLAVRHGQASRKAGAS